MTEHNREYKVYYSFMHRNEHPYLADEYRIYRQDGINADYELIDTLDAVNIGTGFSVQVTGIDVVYDCGIQYNYKVSAFNARGEIDCINPLFSGIDFPCPTPTRTPSSSITPSNSVTPSRTVTPTVTPSITASVTPSKTPPESPSVTPSISVTKTVTPTVTQSRTPSNTPPASPSVTPTITQSITVTPSVTQSLTPSNTPPGSPSVTPTITQSITTTPSITSSITATPSPTNSPPGSPSVTPTITQSVTVTPSVTQSLTPSNTPPGSPSVTPTITQSVTPSNTPPASPSVTPTITQSVTVTPSVTQSLTPSNTPPPSPSVTPTITQSITATPSVTPPEEPVELSFRWQLIDGREILQVKNVLKPTNSTFNSRDTSTDWSTVYAFIGDETNYDLNHDTWPDAATLPNYLDFYSNPSFEGLNFTLSTVQEESYKQLMLDPSELGQDFEYVPSASVTDGFLYLYVGDHTQGNDPNESAAGQGSAWPVIAKKIIPSPTPTATPTATPSTTPPAPEPVDGSRQLFVIETNDTWGATDGAINVSDSSLVNVTIDGQASSNGIQWPANATSFTILGYPLGGTNGQTSIVEGNAPGHAPGGAGETLTSPDFGGFASVSSMTITTAGGGTSSSVPGMRWFGGYATDTTTPASTDTVKIPIKFESTAGDFWGIFDFGMFNCQDDECANRSNASSIPNDANNANIHLRVRIAKDGTQGGTVQNVGSNNARITFSGEWGFD